MRDFMTLLFRYQALFSFLNRSEIIPLTDSIPPFRIQLRGLLSRIVGTVLRRAPENVNWSTWKMGFRKFLPIFIVHAWKGRYSFAGLVTSGWCYTCLWCFKTFKAINRNLYVCGTVPAILQLMTTGYHDSSREGQNNFSMSME